MNANHHLSEADQERLFFDIVENAPDPVLRFDPRFRVQYLNKAAEVIAGTRRGVPGSAPAPGRGMAENAGVPGEVHLPAGLAGLWEPLLQHVIADAATLTTEFTISTSDGPTTYSAALVPGLDTSGEVVHVTAYLRNVNRYKAEEARLTREAMLDPLTQLPNRLLFRRAADVALARASDLSPAAVLFVDLDGFKLVNDSRGHDTGDLLLTSAAARVRSVLRPADIVSRYGGDEFTILCEETGPDQAMAIAARIIATMALPFHVGDGTVTVGASVGVTVSTIPTTVPEALARADAALREAKRQGKGRSVAG